MNLKLALETLGLRDDCNWSDDEIKKAYRSKILQYHPDKNKSPDSASKFIDIQTAYTFLQGHDNKDEYRGESYGELLKTFLYSVLREESGGPLITKIVELICKKICMIVENNSDVIIDYLRTINRDTLTTIRGVLSKYRSILHFSSELFERIDEVLEVDECIILNPTLEDLISDENIYILKYSDRSYLVPLWQHEMVFDISGRNLVVKNFPILPDNMELDECNVLTVRLQYRLSEIWKREVLVEIGGKPFVVRGDLLRLTDEPQQIKYENHGIPYNDSDNVLDASRKQSIIFDVIVSRDIK